PIAVGVVAVIQNYPIQSLNFGQALVVVVGHYIGAGIVASGSKISSSIVTVGERVDDGAADVLPDFLCEPVSVVVAELSLLTDGVGDGAYSANGVIRCGGTVSLRVDHHGLAVVGVVDEGGSVWSAASLRGTFSKPWCIL